MSEHRSEADERSSQKRVVPPERTRADAVVGWRYWQLTAGGRLRSVTQRRFVWAPGVAFHAGCMASGHKAPDRGCECGIHASRDLDTLREHGLCMAPEALVVGRVALWGTVVPTTYGWRGEWAEPVSLSVVRELVAGYAVQATQASHGVQATQASHGVQATQASHGVQATQARPGLDATLSALGAYGVPVDLIALADAVGGVSAAILANQAMALSTSRPASTPPVLQ